MKSFLKILSICFLSLQSFAGPGASGGGMPGPLNICHDIPGNLAFGKYFSNVTYGYSSRDQVVINPGNIVQISLEKLPINSPAAQFSIQGWSDRYGRIHGVAQIDGGRCQAEFLLVKNSCGMRMEMPFWLSEFLFTPQSYKSDCRNAIETHRPYNYAPASKYFISKNI